MSLMMMMRVHHSSIPALPGLHQTSSNQDRIKTQPSTSAASLQPTASVKCVTCSCLSSVQVYTYFLPPWVKRAAAAQFNAALRRQLLVYCGASRAQADLCQPSSCMRFPLCIITPPFGADVPRVTAVAPLVSLTAHTPTSSCRHLTSQAYVLP